MGDFSYNLKEKIDKDYFVFDIMNQLKDNKKLVMVCVGTDKIIGDSFGPFVGTLLNEIKLDNIIVYGDLINPIHALNVDERSKEIKMKHPNDLIIGIDASLSSEDYIFDVDYKKRPLKPGKGVGKELNPVGEACILCYTDTIESKIKINKIRLGDIYKNAKFLVSLIKELDNKITEEREQLLNEVSCDL